MPFARFQFTVTDDRGNIVPQANVRVRAERAGQPLVQLFADRFGQSNLSNPFQADSEGFAAFHVGGGAYQVEAFKGAFSRIWRYVGVGLAQESDLQAFVPRGEWDNAVPYGLGDLVTHGGFVYASIVDGNLSHEPQLMGSPATGVSDEFWQSIPALQGADGAGDLYDFSVNVQSKPRPGEIVARHEFTSQITFEEDLARSRASSDVAATAETVFSITQNGTEFATVTFAAASNQGVFGTSDATIFSPGDILRIVAPDPRDLTIAEVTFTLLGDR